MEKYSKLAIEDSREFLFGAAPRPLKLKNGMVIGGGTVYPR